MSELETLQRWFTSILIRPGALHDRIQAADRTYGVAHDRVVRSSDVLPGRERIQMYARGYVLRLMECLRAEYPALRNLLGEELFDMFAQAYLARRPSGSPSLFDLGQDFPEFLEASRPQQQFDSVEERQRFDLPIELARLERARSEAYRSRGTEDAVHDDESPVFFLFGAEPLRTAPCLRLLELQFPLIDFLKAVDRGEQPPVPSPRPSFTAVSRRNYIVTTHEIEPWQWHVLAALERTGDLMQAVAGAAAATALPQDTLMADLMLWIPTARALGFVGRGG